MYLLNFEPIWLSILNQGAVLHYEWVQMKAENQCYGYVIPIVWPKTRCLLMLKFYSIILFAKIVSVNAV